MNQSEVGTKTRYARRECPDKKDGEDTTDFHASNIRHRARDCSSKAGSQRFLKKEVRYQKTLLFPQRDLIRRGMRGRDEQQLDVFSYICPEQRVPQDHPLRSLRAMTDEALRGLQPRFNKLYAKTGRPSIAPEKLLRALLLQALYSVRSERLLMEQLDYNLLFRWFVGLNMDDAIWDVTVFTKNRERLLDGDIAEPSSKRCSSRRGSGICSRTSTSPWMERYWRRGRV